MAAGGRIFQYYSSLRICGVAAFLVRVNHKNRMGEVSGTSLLHTAYRQAASISCRAMLTGSGSKGSALRGNQPASSISDGSGVIVPPA